MEKFSELIKNDRYQVFLLGCKAHFPFEFAHHSWLVINKKGKISRYEIRHYKNKKVPELGHLFLGALPPFQGIETFPFFKKPIRETEFLGSIEGDENSLAQKMAEFIESSKESYPYLHKYFVTGPNSNTYTAWVLRHFPEFNVELGRGFMGKSYD